MMEICHARTLEDVQRIAPPWRVLADECGMGPLVGPDWTLALVAAYGLSRRFHGLSAWEGDQLVAVLPLLLQPSRLPGLPLAWLSGTTTGVTLCYDLLADRGDRGKSAIDAIWRELVAWRDWTYLEMHPVPRGGGAERLIDRAAADGYPVHSQLDFGAYSIDLDHGVNSVLASTSRDFRAELRRTRRRLEERGALRLGAVAQPGPQDLDDFFALEAAGWKGHTIGGNAVLVKPPAQRIFYQQLAASIAAQGRFLLHRLLLNEHVIAASIGLVCPGTYVAVKWCYDEQFAAFGPGHLLIESLLHDCANRGLDRFEFGGEEFAYKRRWTKTVMPYSYHYIFRRNWRGRCLQRLKRSRQETAA